jgi:RNA polymerase sigma-70 factor (sigma-E family)
MPADSPSVAHIHDEMGTNVLAMASRGSPRARGADRSATEDAFAAVYNAHHRQAVRLAYLLVSDPHQAEDVVSEAFAKVYVRWRKGDVRDVGAYVRRAVVNEANSRLRRRYLERRVAAERSGDDRGVRLVDEAAAEHDVVWQGIQRLPARQRAAVVLRYYEDLSEAETAEILGCSVGTVKSNTSRGLARLQELLGGPDGHATRDTTTSHGGDR